MANILVAYFSASGVTAKVASVIAEAAEADLFEIKPAQPYTAQDLNWNDRGSRSSIEMKDPASRVEIAQQVDDINAYDCIFLGYPVWWGVAPHIINTFLESYDLSGKKVIPFATSGGSGIGNTRSYLGASVKGADLMPGKLLSTRVSKSDVEQWLQTL